jgi:hypothetical protein
MEARVSTGRVTKKKTRNRRHESWVKTYRQGPQGGDGTFGSDTGEHPVYGEGFDGY